MTMFGLDRKVSEDRRDKRPRRRRVVRRVLIGGCLVSGILLGAAVYLLRSEPDYWTRHRAFIRGHSSAEIEMLARSVQQRLDKLIRVAGDRSPDVQNSMGGHSRGAVASGGDPVEQGEVVRRGIYYKDTDRVTKGTLVQSKVLTAASSPRLLEALHVQPQDIRVDVTRELFVSEPEMQALVAARLDDWMASRGYVMPPYIHDPMVTVDDDGLWLGFEVQTPYVSQVFSARFDVAFLSDGMATLKLEKVYAGNLPLPVDGIGWFLRRQAPGNGRVVSLARWLDKLNGLEFKPVVEIAHRRRARVQSIERVERGAQVRVRVQDHMTYKRTNEALAAVETP